EERMGLVFLYREGGQWWVRRRAQGSAVTVEPAGVPAEWSASEAHGIVQGRSFNDKVVVESAHDTSGIVPDSDRFVG
ncbi:MAG TPA: hypothetical protein VIK11_14355, partial [Tepidiformaceae bacterium]